MKQVADILVYPEFLLQDKRRLDTERSAVWKKIISM